MTDQINHPQSPTLNEAAGKTLQPPFTGQGSAPQTDLPQRHPDYRSRRQPEPPAPIGTFPSAESHQERPNGSGHVRTLPTAGTGIRVAGGMAVDIAGKPVGYHNMIQAYICGELVPEWERLFIQRNTGYGDGHRELGIKAQYVDIHRKVSKLRAAFWDGVDTSNWNEQPREILLDLIGHCFLTISLLDEDGHGDEKGPQL